jgi:peptidoglycan/LPS O-acetylase OafA/YrhL
MTSFRYIPALDGVRCLAVTAVLVGHSFRSLVEIANQGVNVFFVLSGFLITGVLLKEHHDTGRIRLSAFYMRRALRLFPALWLMLGTFMAVALFFFPQRVPELWPAALAGALYVMNWVNAFELFPTTMFAHTWSLAIEEQFYLLWPLVLIASLAYGRRVALAAAVGLAAASAAWAAWLWYSGAPAHRTDNGFDTRACLLLVGCAIALGPELVRQWIARLARPLLPILTLAPSSMSAASATACISSTIRSRISPPAAPRARLSSSL